MIRANPALDWVPGMMQTRDDLTAWQEFIIEHKPASFVELGTASGNFTRWLSELVPCVATFDRNAPLSASGLPNAPAGFRECDIFSPDGARLVRTTIAAALRPVVLFCDNGDKPREVLFFDGALERGDFLAVHDYGVEIDSHHIPAPFPYTPIGGRGLTRFYRLDGGLFAGEGRRRGL